MSGASTTMEIAPPVAGPSRGRYANTSRAEAARVYDIRIATDLPEHRKITKLRSLLENAHPQINLGDKGFRCLIQLWTRAGRNHRSGVVRLSAEDLEFEAGWRDGMCPSTHHGLLVRTLIQAGFLIEIEADAAYELHDWAEHQPWVTEGLRASVAGRFHKIVALAKSRQGLSHEEALRLAHSRVPEFAQLTKTTLEDQLDEIADVPEQIEISSVGASRAEILGEKPTPRGRTRTRKSPRAAAESMLAKIDVPDGLHPEMLRRFLEHRAGILTLKQRECVALAGTLKAAADDGIDLSALLQMLCDRGYTDVPLTLRFQGAQLRRQAQAPQSATAERAPRARPTSAAPDAAQDDQLHALFKEVAGVDFRNPDRAAIEQFFAGRWVQSTPKEPTPPASDASPMSDAE